MHPLKIFIPLIIGIATLMLSPPCSGQSADEPEPDKIDTTATKWESSLYYSISFKSRYVWRGFSFGSSPSLQGDVSFAIGNFEFGIWNTNSLTGNQDGNDFNPYIYYYFGDFNISVYDYFTVNDAIEDNDYFNYNQDETGHQLEAILEYNSDDHRFRGKTGLFFYGYDEDYSMYLETGYKTQFKNTGFDFFMGISPYKGYYAHKFAIVNMGITARKDFTLTKELSLEELKQKPLFVLPTEVSLVVNPYAENVFLVFSLYLRNY